MQIAIVGCGAVAAIHASRLHAAGIRVASVCGSSIEKARAFAAAHAIERAANDLDSALDGADAAIIASPSALHYQQARRALERRVHVLVELPPYDSSEQAEDLARVATESKLVLQCAHTSRYLEPYRRIRSWIHDNHLGDIRQIHYLRGIVPSSERSWIDDALLHHAAHPVDLFLDWFGTLQPVGCVAMPASAPHRDVSLLARLPNGAAATIAVSYSAKNPWVQLTLLGERHTVVTDGFSSIESDDPALRWQGDAAAVYEQAIADQDMAFLECCETGLGGIRWAETMLMTRHVEAFQKLCMI
jgi:2-hydroxy-4-carboxymuconate semialdehyde hemiacetal dehydrogenase